MGNDVTLAADYSTGVLSKDTPTEYERIHLLQDWIDPETREVISKIGVRPGWRCPRRPEPLPRLVGSQ